MRRRVFVIAGEYSANPRPLPAARRTRSFLNELLEEPPQSEFEHLFFRYPNRSEDGRARPEDWAREFGLDKPVGLLDLFTSAAHRGLSSLHRVLGGGPSDYQATRDSITDLYVTAMPGLDLSERTNIGLVPQMLKGMLGLAPRTRAQFVVGTSDSGAGAFAQAVRAARVAERPATILVLAGQIIPSGYTSQYQIRTVLGEDDQARGLDMLAVGGLVMDVDCRSLGLTRDEERVARLAARRNPRYRRLPLVEVLGVGEGSSNANFLQPESPLLFATAVREALAATADDARLPHSVFSQAAFAVLHDAFPSIE